MKQKIRSMIKLKTKKKKSIITYYDFDMINLK